MCVGMLVAILQPLYLLLSFLSGCFSIDSLRLFFLIRRRIGIDSAFGKSRASIVQSYSAFATDVSSMTSTSLSSSGEPSATY